MGRFPGNHSRGISLAIDRWGDLLRAIDAGDASPSPDDALDAFAEYVLQTSDVPTDALQMAFTRNLNRFDDTIMTTAQRLHRDGMDQGLRQGRSQGLEQGRIEGRVQTLTRQLQRRFGELPPALAGRLQQATLAELDRWTDRVLDAATVHDVFAD